MKNLFLVLAALCLGCSSDSLTTPTQAALTGAWNLTAVNNSPLPYVVSQVGTNKQEVAADVLTLTDHGTFTDVTTIQKTVNGSVTTQTVTDSGTYDFNSYVVTFHFQSNGSIGSGTLTGRTMTIVTSGVSFTYKKS